MIPFYWFLYDPIVWPGAGGTNPPRVTWIRGRIFRERDLSAGHRADTLILCSSLQHYLPIRWILAGEHPLLGRPCRSRAFSGPPLHPPTLLLGPLSSPFFLTDLDDSNTTYYQTVEEKNDGSRFQQALEKAHGIVRATSPVVYEVSISPPPPPMFVFFPRPAACAAHQLAGPGGPPLFASRTEILFPSQVSRLVNELSDVREVSMLARALASRGFDVTLRSSQGGGEDCLRNLRHQFILLREPSQLQQMVIDPYFRQERQREGGWLPCLPRGGRPVVSSGGFRSDLQQRRK